MKIISKNKILLLLLIITFTFFFKLTYTQATTTHGFKSDTQEHIKAIIPFSQDSIIIVHPLWHISVLIVSEISNITIELSSALVTAFTISLWIVIIYLLVTGFLNFSEFKLLAITFIIIIIGPMYIPGLVSYIVHGQGSPNLWHNVTLAMLKPIAFIAFFYTLVAVESKKMTDYILASFLVILSLFAKPSFVIAFLPALFFFLIIKNYTEKQNIVFFSLLSIVSLLIILFQLYYAFNINNSVRIDFLASWSLKSMNIPLSISMSLAFPFVLVGLYNDVLKDDKVLLSWLMIIISLIYATLLVEEGPRAAHGNFMWSYMLSLSFVYTFSIINYFVNYSNIQKIQKYILNTILFYQVLVGLYYLSLVYIGYNPIYV